MTEVAARVIDSVRAEQDAAETSLRPVTLEEFVGQRQLRDNLRVFIEAAKHRREALDHVLFSGPPGLGKTTLAHIVAREMGVGFRATSGPVIQRGGDLAALLTNLQPRDVLFIFDRRDPLPRDGRLSARPDHWRGSGGAVDPNRSRALHPGRCDDTVGSYHTAAARTFRHPAASSFL